MSTEPGESIRDGSDEFLKYSGGNAGKTKDGNAVPDFSLIDNEVFLREAFRKDEWLGCTLLFEHYYAPMCSHSVRYVYSREYAEDVVSDVFKEFWQKKHFRRINTTFRTYLFRAVRNRSLNYIRRELRQTSQFIEDFSMISEEMKPDEQMIYDQFYQKIQSCIDQLPPMCKKVFLLSRYEGKPLGEIADLLGISIRTVEAHISKALGVLRTILKNEN